MLGLAGLVVSLLLLMLLAYRGGSVILLAPLLALLAALFAGDVPLLATYTQVFMSSLGGFVTKYFPLFLLGAVFGKLMEDSGSAHVIADRLGRLIGRKHAALAVVLCCAVLTYGGVSLFVVVFAIYPFATALFREANLPKRLIPGAIALGSFTFTMTCLPGTVQIQNLIPMPYFQTTAFAAPGLGIIGGAILFLLGMAWLNYRSRAAVASGEGYGTGHLHENATDRSGHLPHFAVAVLPIVWVVVCNYAMSELWMRHWDASYLAEVKYGATELEKLRGIWASILALASAVALVIVLNFRLLAGVNESLTRGAMGALLPIFNTASEVGYGATIASLPAFAYVKSAVINFVPQNALVSEATAVTLLAGITGSASGGLSIALEALGSTYYQRALELGVSPELMHRVASMASGGLDTLPHNGAVITLLTICGLTHKQSYLDIGVVSVIVPLISTAAVIALGMAFGSF